MRQLMAMILLVFMACMIIQISKAHHSFGQVASHQLESSLEQAERQEFLFPRTTPENKVSGELMKAFYVAYNKFVLDKRISENHKQLESYDIAFKQSKESYYVYFLPKSKPGEMAGPGGATSLGRYVTYEIRKADFQVTATQFYK